MSHPEEYGRLVQLSLEGSREAFSALYEATIQDVYKTVHYLTEEKTDVDDIVQEIYIQVHKSLKRYDASKPFRPWLTGLAIRQIHAYRKKRWMRLRIGIKALNYTSEKEEDFSPQIVEKISNRSLLAAVNQLPFKQKQAVVLRYLNEYTQEEIAEILDIPVGTVKSRIHAALQKLRQRYERRILIPGKVEKFHGS
ncbi:sigma-70 family RNA polymerase sigma factor [Paenibacillus jiagnxiensis]|uniref:sigma-70 family RNA polymerase sigma factor n=1 Tax=Paenibacillus jiagnxiensis TaxID=3228926 RepID=UPI0033B0DCB6